MQEDKIPKIFISYSWSSDELVMPLAQRLMSHRVNVVLDKWDLKEGQDKYAFMEQCVNDSDIDKVLIICDKKYAEKANNREGGVGDETAIISTEVYGKIKQEKFIPVIAERDESGNPYVPTYIKSRIYIDLSDEANYEKEYEKLLRNIYESPLNKKPNLGEKPEWLEENKINIFPLQDTIKQIKDCTNNRKQEYLMRKFCTEYIEVLKQYHIKDEKDPKIIFETFRNTKSVRDCFLDFVETLLLNTQYRAGEFVGEFFEEMYNTLIYAKTYLQSSISYDEYEFEIYRCHLWELIICVTALFRHYRDYKSLNCILEKTYFLRPYATSDEKEYTNYSRFRHHSKIIDEYYNETLKNGNKITVIGDTLCNEREKLPIYTKEKIAQADLFLYQVFNALNVPINDKYVPFEMNWFPVCYIYVNDKIDEWEHLKSKKYCEKMFDLFGVTTVDELKERISRCEINKDIRYRNLYKVAPVILNYIKIDEIATLN